MYRPADHAGLIASPPAGQSAAWAKRRPLLKQRLDPLPVRARGALLRRHLQQRMVNRLATSSIVAGAASQHCRSPSALPPGGPKPVPGPPAGSPLRVFCCRDRQAELHRRFFDRDRLPLPTGARPGTLSGHYSRLPVLRSPRTSAGPSTIVLSFSGLPAHIAGTQQISWGEMLRFHCDRVANTLPVTTNRDRASPPLAGSPTRQRLTALHSRSPPQRTYGLLQTRPHGSFAAQPAALKPPGQFRAAPLPHRCRVPSVRAPGQDFHLRSQHPYPAHQEAPLRGRLRAALSGCS